MGGILSSFFNYVNISQREANAEPPLMEDNSVVFPIFLSRVFGTQHTRLPFLSTTQEYKSRPNMTHNILDEWVPLQGWQFCLFSCFFLKKKKCTSSPLDQRPLMTNFDRSAKKFQTAKQMLTKKVSCDRMHYWINYKS